MKRRGLVGAGDRRGGDGARSSSIDARPRPGRRRARGRARAAGARVRSRDGPVHHDPPAGRRAFSLLHSPSPNAPAPGARLAARASTARRPPMTPRSRICCPRSDLAESDRIADLSRRQRPGSSRPRVAGRHRDADRRARAAARQRRMRRGRASTRAPARTGRSASSGGACSSSSIASRRRSAIAACSRWTPTAVTSIAWRGAGGAGELTAVDGRWQNGRKEWVANERVAESLRRLLALRIDRFEPGPAVARRLRRTHADDDRGRDADRARAGDGDATAR